MSSRGAASVCSASAFNARLRGVGRSAVTSLLSVVSPLDLVDALKSSSSPAMLAIWIEGVLPRFLWFATA